MFSQDQSQATVFDTITWKKEIAEMGPLSQVGQTGWVCFPMEDAEYLFQELGLQDDEECSLQSDL